MNTTSLIEINITGLYKSFHDNTVLRGIDLEIGTGEIIAIVGGSGCGKTVLLNCILSQYPVDKGCISVLDRSKPAWRLRKLDDFNELEIDDIHKHWGVVFQRNALFSGSVLFNLALWLREIKHMDDEQIYPIAMNSLRAVELPASEEFLQQSINDLSGGMAKRLAIARAISMNPYMYFYDEPTTGLDPASSANIHDLIYSIHNTPMEDGSARTTLIITHDKDLLKRLRPRTVMLHQGQVYFDGPFDDFEAADTEVIRPYFKLMPVLQRRYGLDTEVIQDIQKRKGLVIN